MTVQDTNTRTEHQLLVIHEKAGVQEITAPGETVDDAVNSERVMRAEDALTEEYGEEPNCVVLPANTPADHPLVSAVDASMPSLNVGEVLWNRGNA